MGSLFIALALLSLHVAPQGATAKPGEVVPDFELRAGLGGDGRTKLSEFRGQPVLISWYSTVFAGVEGARASVDIEQEVNTEFHESRLVVFLMEIRNHDATYLRALQMAELPGASCRLIRNQNLPFTFDDSTGPPPRMALIGADGRLLYAGSYQRSNEVKRLVKEELARLDKGWGEDPLARQARALAWGQGKLGAARALLEPALAGGGEELRTLAAEIDRRFEAQFRAVGARLEQGEPALANVALASLAVAADGYGPWLAKKTEAQALVTTADAQRAVELEKKLDGLLKPTLKARPKKGLDQRLRAFADGDAAGTKVGARARLLADAVARIEAGLAQ